MLSPISRAPRPARNTLALRNMAFFDLKSEFFRPLWRRIVVVVICFGWAGFEFISGAPFWGVIFAGMGAVAAYQFFVQNWTDIGMD